MEDIQSQLNSVALEGAAPEGGRTEVSTNNSLAGSTTSNEVHSWNLNTAECTGFSATCDANVRNNLRKKDAATGSTHDFSHFSIGSKPAVRGRYIATGTDNPDAARHFLTVLDGEIMKDDARADPVVAYLASNQHFCDVKWLTDTTILAATGQGNIRLFGFDAEKKSLKHVGDMPGAAGSYIREIGVNPYSSNQIAIGGYDYHLQLLDLNQPKTPYVQRINMSAVIGSIKWAPFQSGQFVSFTNDEGKFFMFDTRTAIKDAAFYQHTKEVDLFCHERYSDFGVLLGYGDGTIKHIDMRVKDKILHSVQDPYIDAIGQIEYNAESEAIVVSGYTDFSVYKIRNGEAKIWSHSMSSNDLLRAKGWAGTAAWYDAATTVCGDNAGGLAFHIQDFA